MAWHRSSFVLAALLALLSPFARAQGSNPPLVASNTSSYQTNQSPTEQNVIAVMTTTSFNSFNITALTTAANNTVDHSSGANINNSTVGTGLCFAGPNNTGNVTTHAAAGPIAFISCDSSDYPGNYDLAQTIQASIGFNAMAILFYSQTSDFCNLSPNYTASLFNSYSTFFSTVSKTDSMSLLSQLSLNKGYEQATIGTLQGYNNAVQSMKNANGFGNSLAGTNVAMIILYSITGVIALLFVLIIVTGAVRAHRHPERYGPRNVTGRPRQTRAAGIGRAMLETIPLVKFGEETPAKPTDIEMNAASGTGAEREPGSADASTDAEGGKAHMASARKSGESAASRAATTTKAEESGRDAVGMNHTEKVEKSLECAICWEDFEKGEEVRMLPCEHKFHPKCIDPWLLGFSGTCPVCRIAFGQPSKEDERESNEGSGDRNGSGNGGEGRS